MKTIELIEQCPACGGTGLYIGIGERDGSAVVCHKCKGTGEFKFTHSYEDFIGKKDIPKPVERVFQYNPGITIGKNETLSLSDFGGMPYKEWAAGFDFPEKSEMRKFTCPAWLYQGANYELKPNWKECGFGAFSGCPSFAQKEKCWERWDKEYDNK